MMTMLSKNGIIALVLCAQTIYFWPLYLLYYNLTKNDSVMYPLFASFYIFLTDKKGLAQTLVPVRVWPIL